MREQTNTEQRGSVIDDLVEEFTRRVQEGEPLEAEAFAAAHPEHAERLRALLPVAALLAQAGEAGESRGRTDFQSVPLENGTDSKSFLQAHEPISGVLGDFHILREIGRGGMGVVYEAEQISLRRHVALKVLPFAGILDARQLQRFKNEAQAAAGLHHPHIVPVHAVGVDRGVHFYAMQYIEGRTLADVIAAVRGESGVAQAAAGPHAPTVGVASSPEGVGSPHFTFADRQPSLQPTPSPGKSEMWRPDPDPDTSPIAKLTTDFERNAKAYARRVAELGIQAADALDYAHQLGIVHRDVKPSNLILDERGEIWVTDFGLAITPTGGALTQTGEMVGTLRYMSPEQLVAERGIIDHRTDVYSLGATLYELLSLRPMWEDAERAKLLQHILTDDPEPLRKRNPAIPVDLETIVLKALEKSSGGRYSTAREMGEDLRRFVEDGVIVARPPGLLKRTRRWARQHKPALAAIPLAVVAGLAVASWFFWERVKQRNQTERLVSAALSEADLLRAAAEVNGNDLPAWSAALAEARRAQSLASAGSARTSVYRSVERHLEELQRAHDAVAKRMAEHERDRRMLEKLQAARMAAVSNLNEFLDDKEAAAAYLHAFREYGINIEVPADAVARIRTREIRAHLVEALIDWSFELPQDDSKGLVSRRELCEIALAASSDEPAWHRQLLTALLQEDFEQLTQWAGANDSDEMSVSGLVRVAMILKKRDAIDEARSLLESAWQRNSQDYWMNQTLGVILANNPYSDLDRAIRYFVAAAAVRPHSALAHSNLGVAFRDNGEFDAAIAAHRRAIELAPDNALAHVSLGDSLRFNGEFDAAFAEYRRALELNPDFGQAYSSMGVALEQQGDLSGAVAAGRRAIALTPDSAAAHANLGNTLMAQGDLRAAEAEYRRAIQIEPDSAKAHMNLGTALRNQGDLNAAVAQYRRAIEIDADLAEAYSNLGCALANLGDLDAAIAQHRRAIELRPDLADAYLNLGVALRNQGDLDAAIAQYRRAIELKPDFSMAYYNFGLALASGGNLDDAETAFRRAIDLKPNYAKAWYNLGNTLRDRRDLDGAEGAFRRVIELEPKFAEAHCNLGSVLLRQANFAGALVAYKHGDELGSRNPNWAYPSREWVRLAEYLVAMESRFTEFLSGVTQPAHTAERIELAQFAILYKHVPRHAAYLFREAFDEAPALADDPRTGHRYNATCAALLTAASTTDDITDDERTTWRQQAHEWLTADLQALERLSHSPPAESGIEVAQTLAHWLQDPDLASVRDAVPLARLPEAERDAWTKLWGDVHALVSRVRASQPVVDAGEPALPPPPPRAEPGE